MSIWSARVGTSELLLHAGEPATGTGPVVEMRSDVVYGWEFTLGPGCSLNEVSQSPSGLAIGFTLASELRVPGHGMFEGQLRLALADLSAVASVEGVRVSVRISAHPDFPITDLDFPGPLRLREDTDGRGWRYLLPEGQGLLADAVGPPPALNDVIMGARPLERIDFSGYRITLPVVAAINEAGSALVVSTTQGHDHAVSPIYNEVSEVGFQLHQLPALGRWGYDREWSVTSLATGGAMGVAKLVRDELGRAGLALPSLPEKLRTVPESFRRSVGGTHLWCHMDTLTTELVEQLRSRGVESLLVMGRPADETVVAAAHRAGYATGPYFQTYDVFPPGTVEELSWRNTYPPEGATSGWPETLRRTEAGFLDRAWIHIPMAHSEPAWEPYKVFTGASVEKRWRGTFSAAPVQSFRRCPRHHAQVIRDHGLPMLERLGASAVFYDIATTMFGLECYCGPLTGCEPCDRRDDVAHRLECLRLFTSRGLVVTSEDGKWWALDDVIGFEGNLNFDGLENLNNVMLTDYPLEGDPWSGEFSLERRLPFFSMVAGHTVAMTHWWGRGQDRHSATRHAKNALTALFGGQPIFVTDDEHRLVPGTERFEFFVQTALAFDVLRAASMGSRLASYERLGPQVGATTYENQVRVVANVGPDEDQDLVGGEFQVFAANGDLLVSLQPTPTGAVAIVGEDAS